MSTRNPAGGLHGPFAWSCYHEHGDEEPCGAVVIAGTDNAKDPHAYGWECVTDLITHPGTYVEEGIRLHGTHELSDDLLAELGFTRGPNCLDGVDVGEVLELSLPEGDETEFVMAAAGTDGKLMVVSTAVFHDLAVTPEHQQPDRFAAYGIARLYGTHVLPEDVIADLFGDDE